MLSSHQAAQKELETPIMKWPLRAGPSGNHLGKSLTGPVRIKSGWGLKKEEDSEESLALPQGVTLRQKWRQDCEC